MYITMEKATKKRYWAWLLLCSVFFFSCQDDSYELLPRNNPPINLEIPEGFPPLQYTYKNNPLSERGVELGQKLFEDGRLSADNLVSCSFCHMRAYAFTHHGHDLSHGVYDRVGIRNAPALQNLAWLSEYFYDGASNNLEMVAIPPIHNELEMAETLPSIINKIKDDETYKQLCLDVYGSTEMTSERMLKALAQYMTVLVSANSRYDQWKKDPQANPFTPLETTGYTLFQEKCATCHTGELFTDQTFKNNGLPPNPAVDDQGRAVVSGNPADRYKFKVPSLRNVAITAPYMHDGRFRTLESVLNFYENGMVASETIDSQLVQPHGLGIALSADEKEAIIAFLQTLTDEEFISKK